MNNISSITNYAASNSSYINSTVKTEKTDDTKQTTESNSKTDTDYSAIVSQMKADSEARSNQLMNYVKEMLGQQGAAIGTADDMWKFLASGEFTVSAAAKAQAQELISENGYYGVEQTSDRIVEFAKALSGGDSAYAEKLLDAFKKGFNEATKAWGKELPDISQKTYDAVVEKFNKWMDEGSTSNSASPVDYYA